MNFESPKITGGPEEGSSQELRQEASEQETLKQEQGEKPRLTEKEKKFAEFYESERLNNINEAIRKVENEMGEQKFNKEKEYHILSSVQAVLEKMHGIDSRILIYDAKDPIYAKQQEAVNVFFDAYPGELIKESFDNYLVERSKK